MTVADVARLNGVSRRTVYQWIYKGEIPTYYTRGGKRGMPRFKLSDVMPKLDDGKRRG
jgi:excisionase family DNA binding protein